MVSEEEAKKLLDENKENSDIVQPYITGSTFCNDPDLSKTGWIINFFDKPKDIASRYSSCWTIVEERVKPERLKVRRDAHRKYWWQFGDKRPALYKEISGMDKVIANARVAKHLAFEFLPTDMVYLNTLHIFPFSDYEHFSILQSNIHGVWALRRTSSVGVTPQYTPVDCFYTFPFPSEIEANQPSFALDAVGREYHSHRKNLMNELHLSITDIYNCFHDPAENSADIAQLRALHVEMDQAVAAAYEWDDLELGHDFHETPQGIRYTIAESARREVLSRLLELNHERYEEEVAAGLHEKKSGKAKSAKSKVASRKKKIPKAAPKAQESFLDLVGGAAEPVSKSASLPGDQIGAWDQCVCAACGKHLAGFQVAEHTESVHGGDDPGYRVVGK